MKTDTALPNTISIQPPQLHTQIFQPKSTVLNHLPLTSPRTYYRSKIFTLANGANPLATAAAPLLTTIAYLRDLPECKDVGGLYQELVHEIKAFETAAQMQGYRSELILVARYILCVTLDEIILATAWGGPTEWQKYKLLAVFHGEDWGGERFFLILERLSADPTPHIDVLELIYLCLNLGFMGKYQMIENGKVALEEVIENLYQCIRWQRGGIKKDLTIQQQTTPVFQVHKTTDPLPTWLLILFSLIFLFTLYAGFNFMLGSSTIPLFEQLSKLLQSHGYY